MDTEMIAQTLKRELPFWENLTAEDQELLLRSSNEARFKAGEQITGRAAECLGGFVVREGSVRVYLMSDEGREVTIVRLRPSDPCLMGASCVLDSIAFDVFMEAERDTSCVVISPQALQTVFDHNLEAENWSLNALVNRFSDIMWNMQQMLFSSFDKRLATFLYEESAREGGSTIVMTQDQMAKHLGSAREVVSRMLSYFAEEGFVKVGRGRVEILDRDRLKKIALAG